MEMSATPHRFGATDQIHKLPTEFELAAIRTGVPEILRVSQKDGMLLDYCNDPKGTLDKFASSKVVSELEKANTELDRENSLEMLLWKFFKEYLDTDENRERLGEEPEFPDLMGSYGLEVVEERDELDYGERSPERISRVASDTFQTKTSYESLTLEYSNHRSSESDQLIIICLPHGEKLISLYNDFKLELSKMTEKEIVECFSEVFSSLQPGFGLQGTFRKAFRTQLFSVYATFRKIDGGQYDFLLKMANNDGGRSRIAFPDEKHKQVSSRSILGLMSGKVLRGKEWLAAATILGLLVSYPLIIKPVHQMSRHMFSPKQGLKPEAIK